ncbi:hypothetical protein [Oceaniglobus trochenteri]|uniref:hypothetical protein n=1 Tax=Oceaniglobus trochenteri TaxID=2763260 RepID=UPI001CFFECA5|nr:hypothetical protein [Oceaniglobus trochenteri]
MLNLTVLIAFSTGLVTADAVTFVQPSVAPPAQVESLRAMAEIDNDPATFTDEEQRKLAVLESVLGTSPIAPANDLAALGS